jgi:hypothetical protein
MKSILRIAATLLIAAAAGAAIHRVVVVRHRCNRELKGVERRMEIANHLTDSFRVASITRSNIDLLEPCAAAIPHQIDFPMLIGSNYWLRGDHPAARSAYRHALEVDRRPEIYLDLGLVELEMGDPRAPADLEAACLFNQFMIYAVPEPLHGKIQEKFDALMKPARKH